jgi:hypothetical protein
VRVASEELGVAFSWEGEPDRELSVVLATGGKEQSHRNIAELKTLLDELGLGRGIDMEVRDRYRTGPDGALGAWAGVLWRVKLRTWEDAAAAFLTMCKAVGMEEARTELTIDRGRATT